MRIGTVDGLLELKSRIGIGGSEKSRGLIDGIGQLLVKISALQDAQRLEEVFDQDVVIVGLGRFQVGISLDHGFWAGIGINDGSWHQVADVGPCDALAEVGAEIGIFFELILCLHAG